MDEEQQNPIVAMAMRLRARRDLNAAIDSATEGIATAGGDPAAPTDAEGPFAALADVLAVGAKRLNSILGKNGITFIRLEKPLRVRLRFRGKRVALDLDRERQLVRVSGIGLEGDYQFDPSAPVPTMMNLSILSTDAGYRDGITGNGILKVLAADAELPRPAHLEGPGPLQF
jgi:hypothetical protein